MVQTQMTARPALRAAWAGHALLSPLAIMLLFKIFKEHFYAEASPGSMCDPYLSLDASRLSQLQKAAAHPREGKKRKAAEWERTNRFRTNGPKIAA